MDISLTKLPWWGQIVAFVILAIGGCGAFYYYYEMPAHEDMKSREAQLVALKGDIPSPIAPPSGCVFRTRCPHAIDACAQHVPTLDEVEPGRWSACIRKEIVMMKVAA